LFTTGALAVIRYAKIHGTKHRPWLSALLARRPTKVAAIALANKIARMVWAMMTRGERYKEPVALASTTNLVSSLCADHWRKSVETSEHLNTHPRRTSLDSAWWPSGRWLETASPP
jgi:hypothetical protein